MSAVREALHQTLIEALPPWAQASCRARRLWKQDLLHVLETHPFPRAVPLKREVLAWARSVWPASYVRARVRGRDPRAPEMIAVEVEREGCPIKGCALPGVGAYDAVASSLRYVLERAWHLDRAPPCAARVRRGAHPSPPLRTQETLQVEGLLAHQHEVDGATDAVGEDREGLGLAVLPFDAAEQFLALRTLRQEQYRGF